MENQYWALELLPNHKHSTLWPNWASFTEIYKYAKNEVKNEELAAIVGAVSYYFYPVSINLSIWICEIK